MTIREDIERLEQEKSEEEYDSLLKQCEESEEEVEDLEEEITELKMELKISKTNWRNDPDPYGYHGIPIVTRLEEMGYPI